VTEADAKGPLCNKGDIGETGVEGKAKKVSASETHSHAPQVCSKIRRAKLQLSEEGGRQSDWGV